MNPYEKAREERIKRNNAMLAQLEVCLRDRITKGLTATDIWMWAVQPLRQYVIFAL